MDSGLKKYRKLLGKLQFFCSHSKRNMSEWRYNDRTRRREYMYLTPDRYYRNKQLTDFERVFRKKRKMFTKCVISIRNGNNTTRLPQHYIVRLTPG